MRNVYSVILLVLAMTVVGCSNGSGGGSSEFRIRCLGGQAFCIISCDLGCNQTGCSVTEIAENQKIRFKFSNVVDPDSVNGASFSIRTATGVAPSGDLTVKNNEVVFEPKVSSNGVTSSFGFRRNESYIITLNGGPSASQTVRDLSGAGLSERFTCTVVASLGVQDADGLPPTVELLSPADPNMTPTTPTIVLRFSELIDTTPLQVALTDASPIRAVLRGTLPSGACNSDSLGVVLSAVPQLSTETVGNREVTVVSFQPANAQGEPLLLPGNSCLTVRVTADLRDLSGRSAIPARFDLITVSGQTVTIVRSETFQDDGGRVPLLSGGTWSNGARPGAIGGDGRHGSFNHENGTQDAEGVWEIDTGGFTIPAIQTLTGQEYLVDDGQFYFSDFVVPSGVRIRFVGDALPVVRVRGQVDIQGEILVSGEELPYWIPSSGLAAGLRVTTWNGATATGQPGTAGGIGAGRGGAGAVKCLDDGEILDANNNPITNGQPGEDLAVPGGHAYAAQVADTGGRGGLMTPSTGEWPVAPAPVPPLVSNIYVPYWSTGGSGGGFMGPGGTPVPPTITNLVTETQAAPGLAFPLLPFPVSPPADYESLDHYMVAGSGGGGGGTHGYGKFGFGTFERWMSGHGGTGGGGTVAIRAGGDVTIGTGALLESRGGRAVLINGDSPLTTTPDINNGISSPGGGGSGGSFLIQSGSDIVVAGTIDVRGAQGCEVGRITTAAINPPITGHGFGGQGAPGFYRLEAIGSVTISGTGQPAAGADNQGALTDRDGLSGDMSTWRSTGVIFPPNWVGYELDVDFDGDGTIDQIYSDSGDASKPLAWEANGPVLLPVKIEFQGANIDGQTAEPIEGTIGPWRPGVGSAAAQGLNLDAVTGFRFNIVYNRALFPNLVVRELRVTAES